MYIFTLLVFCILSILPFVFLWPLSRSISSRKTILIIQLLLFTYWNIVYWGVLYGYLPRSLSVFGIGAPEGSIFMLYWLFTPVMIGVLFLEIVFLFIYSLRKKFK